jgi:dTDP-4-amino-4,6-dideoxygalactose transaminase
MHLVEPGVAGDDYVPTEVSEVAFVMSCGRLHEELKKPNISARRYFCPLVSDPACCRNVQARDPLTVAKVAAERILTLSTCRALLEATVRSICRCIREMRAFASTRA